MQAEMKSFFFLFMPNNVFETVFEHACLNQNESLKYYNANTNANAKKDKKNLVEKSSSAMVPGMQAVFPHCNAALRRCIRNILALVSS